MGRRRKGKVSVTMTVKGKAEEKRVKVTCIREKTHKEERVEKGL